MCAAGGVVRLTRMRTCTRAQTTFLSHSYLHFSLDRLGEQPAAYGTVSFFTYLILFNVMVRRGRRWCAVVACEGERERKSARGRQQ